MDETEHKTRLGRRRRRLILGLGVAAQAAACSVIYGLPFLIPAIRGAEHLSLPQVGAVASAPTIGLLLTLIGWGALADRIGERVVIATGMAGCGLLAMAAALTGSMALFVVLIGLAGAFGASVNAASGRMVMGWFAVHERGVAMGIRQTAQPLGVAIGALTLPTLAQAWGFHAALAVPAALCLLMSVLVAVLVIDPPRPQRPAGQRVASPYRTPTLWRLHAASALLVFPQFAISAFSLEYLVSALHWAPGTAGEFLTAAQLAGAAGRLVTGYWSDRVGSRLRPMRQLAIASAAVMAFAAIGDVSWPWLVVLAIALGAVVTVADNGLGFTATAELAGPFWSGRALGMQNTAQNIAAALTPSLMGFAIAASGYATAFAVIAIFPLLAIGLTPVAAETSRVTVADRAAA